jgi:hypothetical protein
MVCGKLGKRLNTPSVNAVVSSFLEHLADAFRQEVLFFFLNPEIGSFTTTHSTI